MDEAKRFLRYVIPGLIFFTETIVFLWVIYPHIIIDNIDKFKNDSSLGLVFSSILVSGGVGYLFSVIHHYWHWAMDCEVDYRNVIIYFYEKKFFEFNGYRIKKINNKHFICDSSNEEKANEYNLTRFIAWTILNVLWHNLLKGSKEIEKVDQKIQSLSDLFHSLGTARVSTFAASIFTVSILAMQPNFHLLICHELRIFFGVALFLLFVFVINEGYKKSGKSVEHLMENAVYNAFQHPNYIYFTPMKVFIDHRLLSTN